MTIYCRVESGVVAEIIQPAFYAEDGVMYDSILDENVSVQKGDEVPIERRFTPEFIESLVDISGFSPEPECWWTYDGTSFSPPVASQPSPEETLAANTVERARLLAVASVALAPLQMAVSLGEATEEENTQAKAWTKYCRELKSLDLTAISPAWPEAPAE